MWTLYASCQLLIHLLEHAVNRARDSLFYAQQRMQKTYDAKHRAMSFEVSEYAYLSPKGLRMSVVGSKKLSSRWLGPFEITTRVGRLAYKLCLPASMSRMHPVFHISLLNRPKDGAAQFSTTSGNASGWF